MFVRVKWFYHPEETRGGKRLVEIKVSFQSGVQSIGLTQSTGEKTSICSRMIRYFYCDVLWNAVSRRAASAASYVVRVFCAWNSNLPVVMMTVEMMWGIGIWMGYTPRNSRNDAVWRE